MLLALLGLMSDWPRRREELPLAVSPGFLTVDHRLMAEEDDLLSGMQAALQALKASTRPGTWVPSCSCSPARRCRRSRCGR